MKRKTIVGLIAIVVIASVVMFAGCVEREVTPSTPTTLPSETPTPTPKIQEASDRVVIVSKGAEFELKFVVKEGSDLTVALGCPKCGETFEQEYTNDRIYMCPSCATRFKGAPVYGSVPYNIAVIKNGVVFAPFRALWEDLGLTQPSMSQTIVKTDPVHRFEMTHLDPRTGEPRGRWVADYYRKTEVTREVISLSEGEVSVTFVTVPPSNIITINGEERQMEAAPFRESGVLYVPLKDLVEPFGFKVRFE